MVSVFSKIYLSLIIVTVIMYIIEYNLSQRLIGVDEENVYLLYESPIFTNALIYISIVKTNFQLLCIHIVYIYFAILNTIFNDIDSIVDFHIFYGLIYGSFYFEYMPFDYTDSKMWYGLMACMYIRNILYKIYKKIF